MNSVSISGTLVRRIDVTRRMPRIIFEVYNPEVRDVIHAVVYGRKNVEMVAESIRKGVQVLIEAQLANIHWRTAGDG